MIINKILEYDNIISILPRDLPKDSYDEMSKLIWKALNYSYYDIPPEWFNYMIYTNENDNRQFNIIMKQVASIDGWAEYTIIILLNCDKIIKNQIDTITLKDNMVKTDFKKYMMALY